MIQIKPGEYATIVFDCDGVLLNSNHVKTQAFFDVASTCYDEDKAKRLVAYHVANGGISRFEKFRHFLSEIVGVEPQPSLMQTLLDQFSRAVADGLLACDMAAGLEDLRRRTPGARWFVVSGGAQDELRDVFQQRGIAHLFDGGIFGSPDDKDVIIKRELASGRIIQPALFVGDSRYDHVVSSANGLAFVFLNGWTEFRDWPSYCKANAIAVETDIQALVAL